MLKFIGFRVQGLGFGEYRVQSLRFRESARVQEHEVSGLRSRGQRIFLVVKVLGFRSIGECWA